MSEALVQLLGVSKTFTDLWGRPRVEAVSDLSLEIARGEVFGLLGPNGAGKSTAIKLLLGLLEPTRGRIAVFARPPRDREARRRTGYLPEETTLHKFLSAEETLDFFGSLLGLARPERRKRAEALLEMVGLGGARDRKVGEMSKGMARRIGLAVALVGDPDLLVLDEPTSGLDPIGTREVKDLIVKLAGRGKTILLSSHLLADVEDACSRIAILYGGKLRAIGPVRELLARDERIRIELERPQDQEKLRALEAAARAAGGDGVEIGPPADRLEAFFLRVVAGARQEGLTTGGAAAGGAVAAFLGAAEKPVKVEAVVVSSPPPSGGEAGRGGALQESPPPTPTLPPPSEGRGGEAPPVEHLTPTPTETPPPAPLTESTKTKAVLDRLMKGGGSS